ncbi:MAG: putative lipid II flippase FtsW [Gammaproteobacteria bacterium]|nr:putative lipid II flippase FtsW [Gammaproteobacteria bacterium]
MSARKHAGFEHINGNLLVLMLALLGIGLILLTSASISLAENNTGKPFYYLIQQLVAVAIGLACAAVIIRTPTDYWEKFGPYLLIGAVLLLAAVLLPGVGRTVNGSTRWISVAGINLQVSEPARLMVLMYLAGYAVRHRDDLSNGFRELLKPMAVVSVVCGLLIMEPDFGATAVMLLISLSVLFVAGVPLRYFIGMALAVAVVLTLAVIIEPYRVQRLIAFLDPWADPYGSGFQLTQSLIAIGSGEWFGAGLGNSVQKLFYLPEAHTDFVFAVFAEEFGVFGTFALLGLFAALVWYAVQIANTAALKERYYQAYLAFGIAVWQGAQVFINIGVNMGVLPTKGLTLPLVSYGRSSLIITIIALALLLRIDMENRAGAPKERSKRRNTTKAGGRRR